MAKWSSATQTEDIALLIEKKNQNRSLRSFKIVRTSTMTNWNQTVISIERLWWAEQATLSLCPWRKMKVNLVRQYMCVVCVCRNLSATRTMGVVLTICDAWMVRYGKYWLWCGWMPSPPQRKSERWRLMQFRKIWTCEEACVNDADLIMFAFIYQFMPVCEFINRFS